MNIRHQAKVILFCAFLVIGSILYYLYQSNLSSVLPENVQQKLNKMEVIQQARSQLQEIESKRQDGELLSIRAKELIKNTENLLGEKLLSVPQSDSTLSVEERIDALQEKIESLKSQFELESDTH